MNRRRLAAVSSLAGVLMAGAAVAAPTVVPTWAVDEKKSTLGFTVEQSGASLTGHFKSWTASISFDPAHPETAQVLATVNVASVTTGDARKDDAVQSEGLLDASEYATATFQATGFASKGGNAYEAKGFLMLRGVTKPLDLPFTLTITGDTAHVVGRAELKETDFGIGQATSASGGKVAPDVTLAFDLVAMKTP